MSIFAIHWMMGTRRSQDKFRVSHFINVHQTNLLGDDEPEVEPLSLQYGNEEGEEAGEVRLPVPVRHDDRHLVTSLELRVKYSIHSCYKERLSWSSQKSQPANKTSKCCELIQTSSTPCLNLNIPKPKPPQPPGQPKNLYWIYWINDAICELVYS